ncbi:radical SAM protein [Bacteroidales bacterium OttesenSCG-928-C03]|nr:radical SAM protein [Bacteroidales bacterium OttesenSCG-928-C03]MDL2326727.1 radical SAM protein [Bacteroidales bacterium OttesenSCG-928-A14]
MKYEVESIVLKIANTCNLNCSYCYVFNKGDNHYVDLPIKMSEDIYTHLLNRIKEHCLSSGRKKFAIVFHGGEPLILGIPYYEKFLNKVNDIFKDADIEIGYLMQSNGTLLTEEWAKFLVDNNIYIGFSIDGYEEIHNQYRIYRTTKKGSFNDVVKGINIYKKYSPANGLSVANTDADPLKYYETMKEIGFNGVGILFLDHNYADPPEIDMQKTLSWFIQLFDIWFKDKSENKLKFFNPFSTIMSLILGLDLAGNDAYGETLNNALLVLNNGEIQVTGCQKPGKEIKTYYVQHNNLDEVYTEKIFRDYYNVHQDDVLCKQCQLCVIKSICGGGRYSHRYSKENQFDNPTVYCEVMKKLVMHIQNAIVAVLPKHVKDKTQIEALCDEDFLS